MPKESFTDQIEKLSFEDVLCHIERNKRALASRWKNSKLYGAGVRNTSILEHKQVLLYDRLMRELLGSGWEEELAFLEYIARWIQRKKKEYQELESKIR